MQAEIYSYDFKNVKDSNVWSFFSNDKAKSIAAWFQFW